MFRRKVPTLSVVASPRVKSVRLLETPQDLQAALDRAEEFERTHGYLGRSSHYRAMRDDGVHEIVPIQSTKAS